jgi:chromate transport protein ChrA
MKPNQRNFIEIGLTAGKLGCIGFGGIAGMVGLMESELVTKSNGSQETII